MIYHISVGTKKQTNKQKILFNYLFSTASLVNSTFSKIKIYPNTLTNMMKISNRCATALAAMAVVHVHDNQMSVEAALGDPKEVREVKAACFKALAKELRLRQTKLVDTEFHGSRRKIVTTTTDVIAINGTNAAEMQKTGRFPMTPSTVTLTRHIVTDIYRISEGLSFQADSSFSIGGGNKIITYNAPITLIGGGNKIRTERYHGRTVTKIVVNGPCQRESETFFNPHASWRKAAKRPEAPTAGGNEKSPPARTQSGDETRSRAASSDTLAPRQRNRGRAHSESTMGVFVWDANVSEETAEAFCARVETMPGGPFSCKESQVTIAGLTKFVLVIESLILPHTMLSSAVAVLKISPINYAFLILHVFIRSRNTN